MSYFIYKNTDVETPDVVQDIFSGDVWLWDALKGWFQNFKFIV